ncbi:MAG: dTMP kinase [Alphaproteobacteria bacterium]|nr:dTMP kinase [Rhodospirillaceae bacterium]MDP6406548.1 dTMP kinase [Alphaproteobacteria bacterium]MDP6623571.1 dTMP kinase [Alphaproteobacteria bacterium]
MLSANPGRFITLEGGEGTGKSTQSEMLVAALTAQGIEVVASREPGGSPGAEEIRSLLVSGDPGRWDPMSEALLHFAARHDHLERTIRPALDAGRWVVCDRFVDSTLAYQGEGQGLGAEPLKALQHLVIGDFAPDLTLILDLSVEDGLARAAARGGGEDRYERMGADFHRRLRQAFLDIASAEPERCAVIDATGDAAAVHAAIMARLAERLGIPS